MSKQITLALAFILPVMIQVSQAQNQDSIVIRKMYTEALTNPAGYKSLEYLCTKIGGRICGTAKAEEAVRYVKKLLESMKPDTVYLQPVMVKHWERGNKEIAQIISKKKGKKELHVCSLGTSIGTGDAGITAAVIEVHNFDELRTIGKKGIEGKIIFFNRAADESRINTFDSYGGAVDQRARGAMQAARFGASAVIVRSATTSHDNFPHTGVQHYADTVKPIPAMCVSTNDADLLSAWLKEDPSLKLFMNMNCSNLPEVQSANVVGEIRGSEHPEEVIVFGGHLDSWDIGEGAHDDGAGMIQGLEVLRIYKALGIKPKHTIRAVAFMDEEIAQRGAAAYAEAAKKKGEKHIAGIEADRGGASPWGFSIDAPDPQLNKIKSWKPLFSPYNLWFFEKGGSGVDISNLKKQGSPLIGYVTDPQRYFDYHHSANDTFDKVNVRELELGAAAMSGLVYLIDTYGL
ncbi:MAG: M20/M25/M40 family metallo-hydrolase [Bacteroidetes bacterium]|nr:M20/M25/M40 family metallo-hydrolase [Bacteroidota bacterium]